MPETRTDIRHLTAGPVLVLAADAERRAALYYEEGFHCGESVVRAVNEVTGERLAPEVMRLASGFCAGIGGSRCVCGALAGGVMALGLLSGRESADDPWEPSYLAAAELRRRWVEDQDAESCEEVVSRIGEMDHPLRWSHCTDLVGHTARWVIEIAMELKAASQ
jgi:C_GCAxxG_C_C family probable redox protein